MKVMTDVYKRQIREREQDVLDAALAAGYVVADRLETVSYTHLDVYKRQQYGRVLSVLSAMGKQLTDLLRQDKE